ncbi:hypothetical protein P7K49_028970 [Saguinus oedipus]|uniref:Uncharacterized protein n=1 Tax=Saguinus oedipus TaxID=9490 RepID=A0ABQ9U5W2_SAGOE|nr:hypothetical protein P7K49_028970 [Saguinus oedipus]
MSAAGAEMGFPRVFTHTTGQPRVIPTGRLGVLSGLRCNPTAFRQCKLSDQLISTKSKSILGSIQEQSVSATEEDPVPQRNSSNKASDYYETVGNEAKMLH